MRDILILATNNAGKVAEIKAVLGNRYDLRTLSQEGISVDVAEIGSTFMQNAYIKASEIARLAGKSTLADDSGLVVYALGGEPGVRSARYAGDAHDDKANIAKLLAALQGAHDRRAKFVAAVVVCRPNGEVVSAEGEVEGEIIGEERGAGGFGYDPVFFCPELGKTFAEATSDEKNSISHRARALASLAAKLDAQG